MFAQQAAAKEHPITGQPGGKPKRSAASGSYPVDKEERTNTERGWQSPVLRDERLTLSCVGARVERSGERGEEPARPQNARTGKSQRARFVGSR